MFPPGTDVRFEMGNQHHGDIHCSVYMTIQDLERLRSSCSGFVGAWLESFILTVDLVSLVHLLHP
jgi:hypothetical protein